MNNKGSEFFIFKVLAVKRKIFVLQSEDLELGAYFHAQLIKNSNISESKR